MVKWNGIDRRTKKKITIPHVTKEHGKKFSAFLLTALFLLVAVVVWQYCKITAVQYEVFAKYLVYLSLGYFTVNVARHGLGTIQNIKNGGKKDEQ